MSFVLSKAVDPENVFLTRKSDVTRRWDPHYHQPCFVQLFKKLNTLNAKPLRSVAKAIISGITPLSGGTAYTEASNGVAFIRSGDFNEDGTINKADLIYLKPEVHSIIMKRSQLAPHDVLFAIVGATIGKVGIFLGGYEANINQAICAVRLNETVRPHFVQAFFLTQLGKQQIDRVKRPVARANINLEEIADLRLPIVSEAIQKKVVEKLNDGFRQKRARENQAAELMAKIDEILLEELGIALPIPPPNTIENRIFMRPFSEVTGGRFDAASHWKRLYLSSDRYASVKLTDLVFINPLTRFKHVKNDDLISFVPMDSISEIYGEIDVLHTRPVRESGAYTTFQEGDIIWAKITPCMENGKSAIAENLIDGYGFGSTEFHVFRPRNSEIRVQYLHALLRLAVVRDHARLFFGGTAGHQRVDDGFFRRLEIPLPPPIIQDKIIETIAKHKEEARRLFREAEEGVKKAKEAIEAIILGEGAKS